MAELNDHKSRAHALLSASSAHRWLACPPSAVANEAYPDQETSFAHEGTLAHEVAEFMARNGYFSRKDATDEVTVEMVECAKGYADYIEEQKKSNDAIVLLEQRVDFSPWVPDGFGTCDCIIIQDDTLSIIDYKYGQGVSVSAEDNPQMKLYALGAMNDFGIAMDIKKVELHIYQPRLNNISTYGLTVEELMTWAETVVKPVAEKASHGQGDHKPGEHCRFCQHGGRCRALTDLCTQFIDTHGMRIGLPVLAPHEVADVLRMEPMITLWLKKVKEQAMTTLQEGGEIPGYKIVAGRGSRTWADDLEVANVLKAAGYTQEDITKTTLLSVAALETAIGKKKVAELVGGHILFNTGSPTIASNTDKRPAYDRLAEAKADFQ